MLHNLLKRQLRKLEIHEDTLPKPEQWKVFLEKINNAYNDFEQERYLLERSLTISSKEMQELYDKLQKSETRYFLAAKGANDGLWDWNLVTGEAYYSDRCYEITGEDINQKQDSLERWRSEEIYIKEIKWWNDKIHIEDRKRVASEFKAHIKGELEKYQTEYRIWHTDGKIRWILVRGLAIRNSEGKAIRITGSITDITERKNFEEKLAYDAIHDALTDLPNRKFLMDRLGRSLNRLKFKQNYGFALLFCDLDKFKVINDTLGHKAGDELLINVAKKLNLIVRPSDMVARLGGDEFLILIDNVKEEKQVIKIAERIVKELNKPIMVADKKVYISTSIGIAFASEKYQSSDEIVRDADIAMYCSKLKNRGSFQIFEEKMHEGAVTYLQTQNDLRYALEKNQFKLNYQPIISLETDKIIGFEALLRWYHPIRGLVMPNDFISIAEDSGLIIPIGNWVISEACRQMKEWQNQFSNAENLMISVNLSALQLEQEDFPNQVAKILKQTKLLPEHLELEITETVLMKNTDKTANVIDKLRRKGVKVSIDDFGTGYSSLSYLHNFSIDTLKVDRSFTNLIGKENEKAEIIQAIISLALSLGINVVAEGLENLTQLEFLKEHNCNYGQGYYYSKPIDSTGIAELLDGTQENSIYFPIEMNKPNPITQAI